MFKNKKINMNFQTHHFQKLERSLFSKKTSFSKTVFSKMHFQKKKNIIHKNWNVVMKTGTRSPRPPCPGGAAVNNTLFV